MSRTTDGYTTQEILALLDVKPHVLRYWVENIALLTPTYDESGRRRWSAAQARLLFRLRHLIVERGMSVAGAQRSVVEEASNPIGTSKAHLETLRDLLLSLRDTAARNAPHADGRPRVTDGATGDRPRTESGNGSARSPAHRTTFPIEIVDRVSATGAPTATSMGTGCAPLIFRHLGARTADPTRVAAAVRSVIDQRIGKHPAVILHRPHERPAWERAFPSKDQLLLPFGGEEGGMLALVEALAVSPDLVQWRERVSVDILLLWAPETAGEIPPIELLAARARERESGVTCAIREGSGRIEAVALSCDRLEALYSALEHADKDRGGSRVDLVDLLAVEPRVVLLDRCAGVAPWPGEHWLRQTEILWGVSDSR